MADTRRQPAAGKATTPKFGAQSMNELDAALSKAVGARVKITTSLPTPILEGTLFTACTLTNLIAVNTTPAPPNPSSTTNQPGDYHIIPVSHIKTFELLSLPTEAERAEGSGPGFEGALPSIARLDLNALRTREEAAVRKVKERDAMRGRGVTREAQEVFDWLARTLPTRWAETAIIVNDAVRIDAPYGVADCKAPQDKQKSLEQVRKVLEGYYSKKKTAQKTAGSGRPAVATPMPPKKGG